MAPSEPGKVEEEKNGVAPEKVEEEIMVDPKSVITPTVVEAILKGANPDWVLDTYAAKPGTALGDNFMSIMYSVNVEAKCRVSGKVEKLNSMVKTMPKNQMRITMINESQAFPKEVKMYETILPLFLDFQKERGIEEKALFTPWAKSFTSQLTEGGTEDYIALQDLRDEKFCMANRHGGLGLEEVKCVMKALGKFHALSYAKYKGDFTVLRAEYPYLDEMFFKSPETVPEMQKTWIRETFSREAKVVREKDPAANEPIAATIENLLCDLDTFWPKMHKLTCAAPPVAVITHGDTWTNNFMFQFDPVTKKPLGFKFVDFQMSRVGSRCLDIGYFLYTSPKLDLLNNKEEEMLRVYHEAFKGFATELGFFDPEHTLEQLLAEYDEFRLYGIAMGMMLAPIISAQSGDIPDLEGMPEGMDQEVTAESMEIWFGSIDKEKATYDKLLNMAKIHIPKLKN